MWQWPVVNSYILFQEWREKNKNNVDLKRNNPYGQLEFREELLEQLAEQFRPPVEVPEPEPPASQYWPKDGHAYAIEWINAKKNCRYCYWQLHVENKTRVKCSVCDLHYCCNSTRNCLHEAHGDRNYIKDILKKK